MVVFEFKYCQTCLGSHIISLKRGRLWQIPPSNISKPCNNLFWSGYIEEATLHCSVLPDCGGGSLVLLDVLHVEDGITLKSDVRAHWDQELETSGDGGGVVLWSSRPPSGALTAQWQITVAGKASHRFKLLFCECSCSLCNFFSTKALESWYKYSLGTRGYSLISVA